MVGYGLVKISDKMGFNFRFGEKVYNVIFVMRPDGSIEWDVVRVSLDNGYWTENKSGPMHDRMCQFVLYILNKDLHAMSEDSQNRLVTDNYGLGLLLAKLTEEGLTSGY